MDPAILNPATRFARPELQVPRSTSRSPIRRQWSIEHDLDPLFANLSPTSTLDALQSSNPLLAEEGTHRRALLESVADVSTSDRALGIKAALAGKRIREWYQELDVWPWPRPSHKTSNGFEPPSGAEYGSKDGFSIAEGSVETAGTRLEYYGSLAAQSVLEYEERIDTIKDELELLELEELKGHVLATHQRKRSGQGQPEGGDGSKVAYIDDFTSIITATIMQTLPEISRLHLLLGIWSTRLLVLRQIPGFLESLETTEAAMQSAWNVLTSSNDQEGSQASVGMDRATYSTIRDVLERQVLDLGKRLDCMLDALEGREDTLPDVWVDKMDSLEADYGTWVVDAERRVLEHEYNISAIKNTKWERTSDDGARTQTNHLIGSQAPSTLEQPRSNGSGEETEGFEPLSGNVLVPSNHEGSENSSPHPSNRVDGVEAPRNNSSDSSPMQSDGANELSHQLHRILVGTDSPIARGLPLLSNQNEVPEGGWIGRPQSMEFEPLLPKYDQTVSTVDAGHEPRGRSTSKPTPLILERQRYSMASNTASEFSPDVSFPGSSTSDNFSNMSSPEIQQASRAEYFGAPIEVTTPSHAQRDPMETVSRQSSQRTERAPRAMSLDFSSRGLTSPTSHRSRASSFTPESSIPEDGGLADPWDSTDRSYSMRHLRTRSASMQSIEVIPRNEVGALFPLPLKTPEHRILTEGQIRNVTISRSASYSNPPPIRPIDKGTPGNQHMEQPHSFPNITDHVTSDHNVPSDNSQIPNGPPITSTLNASKSLEPPHRRIVPSQSPAKIRNRFEDVADLGPGSTPVKIRQRRKSDTSPRKPDPRVPSPIKNDAEKLEARISSILTEIPAHIRLTSGPELDAPEVRPAPSDPRTPLPRSKTTSRLSHAQPTTPLPAMTLAPAQPKSSRSRPSNGDPEIKLYHLHQSGKDAPIKLFVRLVGEAGERVMVRIGGGWADLGEYLKEYASHHGKRSVSDSRFAIQELPSSPMTGSPAIGNSSAPTSRPGSSHGAASALPATPEMSAASKAMEGTPNSVDSLRPGSAHSWKDEESPLGGAGPKTKKVDVSPTKQAWVDGMLEQARNAATGDKGRDIGDLGKVGGTKRVFLRSKTAH